MNRFINSRFLISLTTTLALCYAAYNLYDSFLHTWSFSIWTDEILTLRTIFYSPKKIITSLYYQGPKGYITDYFPPFYYLIVHFLHQAGAYEFGLRLANNLCVVLTFLFITKKMSAINARGVALCFVMAISTSIYFIDLFRLIRPYTLYFCLQTCAIVCIYVGITKKDLRSFLLAGIFNALSLYTHYATIGNILGEIGCLVLFWIIDKKDRKFLLQATLILLASAAAFLPWLPGYFNAVKSAAAEFGPSQISLSKITKVIELMPGLFSHNHPVVALYALLAVLGAFLTDKRIVILTLAWGLTPGLLIAVNGHPLYIRHLVTLAASLLLLSAFALAKLGDMIGCKIAKLGQSHVIATVVLGFFVAFLTSEMLGDNKERHNVAETAPYKGQVLTACLNYPKADYIFARHYDVFMNTILRWYLSDIANTGYSKQEHGDKNVLLFKQDDNKSNDSGPFFKRLPEMAGMAGFMISGMRLKDTSPIIADDDNKSYKIAYTFSDYKVLEDALSWNNVLVDPKSKTLEPAARLENAEIVFAFRLPKSDKLHFTATLQGSRDAGSEDVLELLVSSDNAAYRPLPKTNSPETDDKRFTQTYTLDSSNAPQQLYVKLEIKPGMTVPCATLNELTFTLTNGDATHAPSTNDGQQLPSLSGAAPSLPTAADFGQIDNPNAGHTISGADQTMHLIAPVFDDSFDLDRDLFLKSNLRIKRSEGCLTCASEEPCQFMYHLNSETPFNSTNIVFYPRIYNDKDKKNYVSVSYSYDGKTFHSLWTTPNNGNLTWFGQRKELTIPLKNKVRNLFLRFDLFSEGSQIQSFGNRAMYIVTQAQSGASSPDNQETYLKTVKRLLGF